MHWTDTAAVYHPREPKISPLWRLLDEHFPAFLAEYDDRFLREYGFLRSVIPDVVEAFRQCGDLSEGVVICKSKPTPSRSKGGRRNFQVFSATEFIAAITQHIPEKSFQLVRYYGWYSNRGRGDRANRQADAASAPVRFRPRPGGSASRRSGRSIRLPAPSAAGR